MFIPTTALVSEPQPLMSVAWGEWAVVSPYQSGSWLQTFQLTPDFNSGFRIMVTTPLMLAPAWPTEAILGAAILPGGGNSFVNVDHLPSDGPYPFDLQVSMWCQNHDGTQMARLNQVTTVLGIGTTSGGIDLTGFSYTQLVGTDIEMIDDGLGGFSCYSNAGGLFACSLLLSGGYD